MPIFYACIQNLFIMLEVFDTKYTSSSWQAEPQKQGLFLSISRVIWNRLEAVLVSLAGLKILLIELIVDNRKYIISATNNQISNRKKKLHYLYCSTLSGQHSTMHPPYLLKIFQYRSGLLDPHTKY